MKSDYRFADALTVRTSCSACNPMIIVPDFAGFVKGIPPLL